MFSFSYVRYFSYARPAQVFYGGENKGESAMKHFEDLGTQVIHTYQVRLHIRNMKLFCHTLTF